MNTLIIAQDDRKVRQSLKGKEGDIEFSIGGNPIRHKLRIVYDEPGIGGAALGGVACSAMDRIKNRIITFAETVAKKETNSDLTEFQIIFIFHQSSWRFAYSIASGLRALDQSLRWRRLPYRCHRAIRVSRVWLLSCESGADEATNDPRLQKYLRQANEMRIAAAAGLTTEKTPPPSNPPEYWKPTIYTFSTGNPVRGGLTLDPENVQFRDTPYELGPNGNIIEIPKPAGNTQSDEAYQSGTPSHGKIYKYEGTDKVDERLLAPTGHINLLVDSF